MFQAGPSSNQGLVSSLMNYLKLPPQLINMSTPASGNNKKNQPTVIETASGLVNIAPLCECTFYLFLSCEMFNGKSYIGKTRHLNKDIPYNFVQL